MKFLLPFLFYVWMLQYQLSEVGFHKSSHSFLKKIFMYSLDWLYIIIYYKLSLLYIYIYSPNWLYIIGYISSISSVQTLLIEQKVGTIFRTKLYRRNTILFQIKIFGRRIKNAALTRYLIRVTARPNFSWLRIFRRINRVH